MAITRLQALVDAQENQAAKIVTPQIDQINWQVNPNDIGWLFHYPQLDKQLGRSRRVYWKLVNLCSL
ncbi:MAG: hypothetical protein CML22_07215 [Rheinheimera sp.]|nr:hypothetical protein [Rheinheimera sp.]MBM34073.1 hypothetical protein [Rheinheimera sp.]|tara:strand:- start:1298 stop:1498 length:201 start_codon:yes stop_codon:yes gene_type:complete